MRDIPKEKSSMYEVAWTVSEAEFFPFSMQDFTLNLLAELSAKPNNTIDSGDYKTYKACDRCRSRKRGCDGLFPCTNCKWAKVEGECHYSVIKQVERVNASKRTCDQCRQKKRKCSGDEPCDVCLKSKSRNENGDPICTYTRKRKREEQDTLTPQPTPPPPQEYINDGYLEGYISNEIVNLMEPPSGVGFEPFQPQLEQHLFQLVSIVLQAIPLKGQDKRDIVSPSGVPPTMNSCLKNALFASACMFSTHPLLHLHGSSLKQRIDTARGYASRAIQHLNFALMNQHFAPIPDTFSRPNDPLLHMPYETFENTDMIRAMLSLAHVSYGIGEGGTAIKLVRI
jgi:hypothetical protein